MADSITVQQGKLVADSSLIPYIRRQDVHFDADNLRPLRLCRMFFDDVAVNQFTQRANKIVVNSRKSLTISPNTGAVITSALVAWQGSAFTSNTFRGDVVTYNSSTKVLVINNLSGGLDDGSQIYLSTPDGATLNCKANITNATSIDTSDKFLVNEKIYNNKDNTMMTVVGTSGENILYVNQNYVYGRLGVSAGTLHDAGFADGDLVAQTSSGTKDPRFATFLGKVEFFKTAASGNTITITPLNGALNVSTDLSNTAARLYNLSNTATPNTQLVALIDTDINVGGTLRSVSNTSNTLTTRAYYHYSGRIATTAASNQIRIPHANIAHFKDEIIYITGGTGVGQAKRVTAVSGNVVTLNSALTVIPTIHSQYSSGLIFTDENGSVAGIFNIPEERTVRFKTGERIFTITDTNRVDDANYTMRASAKFTASGLLNITQKITATPVNSPLPEYSADSPVAPLNPTMRTFASESPTLPVSGSTPDSTPRFIGDGLAQTFFTPKPTNNKLNRGIFITSVDLFFRSKPNIWLGHQQLPVTVKIAQVVNGYPTKNYIARSMVHCKDVNTKGFAVAGSFPSTSDPTTATKFRFKNPVYLEPDTEYALVVSSQSPEYELWIAELGGETEQTTPPQRISEQPYAGLLFKSQNASTWQPYNNQDLMFVINKAVFSTSPGSVFFKMERAPRSNLEVAKLLLHTNDLSFPAAVVDYSVRGLKKNNSTGQVAAESTYVDIKSHGWLRYGDYQDEASKGNPTNGIKNSRYVMRGNASSLIVRADLATTDPDISPIINKESIAVAAFQYIINNAGISNTDISITVRGDGYTSNNSTGNVVYGSSSESKNAAAQLYRERFLANNYNVAFYNITITGANNNPEASGAEGFLVANTNGSNSADYIVITNPGSGYYETPTISIQAPNSDLEEDAGAVIFGETGTKGGNILARYLTREITLVDGFECGDIRVFLDAIKPAGTDIQVYYKILGIDDPQKLGDKSWVRMQKKPGDELKISKDIKELLEFQYAPNFDTFSAKYVENGTQYPIGGKFKAFAIKICLTATDTAVVPFVRNLRISAVPAG